MHLSQGGRERDVGPLGYKPALDGIRAVAIVLVMWVHVLAYLELDVSVGAGGFLGVDLFFVLSGFLITSILIDRSRRDGEIRWRRFYSRRVVRLVPALAAYLVVHLVVAQALHWDTGAELRTAAAALSYTSNWAPSVGWDLSPGQGHIWSLAIEGQFYLLWPAVMVVLTAVRRRTALLLLTGAVVAVMAWRAHLESRYGSGYPLVYHRTDARLDPLLVGAALGLALRSGWAVKRAVATAVGAAGAVVLGASVLGFTMQSGGLYAGGFSLVALAGAALVLGALPEGGALQRILAQPALVWLGRRSYSLYLWHLMVFVLVAYLLPGSSWPKVVLAVVASVACADISYRCIERPFLDGRVVASLRELRDRKLRLPPVGGRLGPAGLVPLVAMLILMSTGAGVGTAARHAFERRSAETAGAVGAAMPSSGSALAGGRAPGAADAAGADATGAGSVAPKEAGAVAVAGGKAPAPAPTVALGVVPPALVAGPLGSQPVLVVGAALRAGSEPVAGHAVELTATLRPAEAVDPVVARCSSTTDLRGLATCQVSASWISGAPLEVDASSTVDGAPVTSTWTGVVPGAPAVSAPPAVGIPAVNP